MWIIRRITDVVLGTVFTAIEDIIGTTCDVDCIHEAVFSEGIGKVPEGFFVASGNEVELVTDAANGASLHFAMQEETTRDGTIADENELSEEGTATFLNKVLDFLAS